MNRNESIGTKSKTYSATIKLEEYKSNKSFKKRECGIK